MPIHLPPISRRRFITGTLAASAGLLFHDSLLAADKPVDDTSWILFSDPHLAADATLVHSDVNMTDHFRTSAKEVLGLPQRPAGFILNGDCAYNHGEPADYAALTGLLKPLREAQIAVYLTLGNHDVREHFWTALDLDKAARPVTGHQVTLIETPQVNWFVLDSLEKVLQTPGLLGPEQLAWLEHSLDAHADKPAIVMLHHNPTNLGGSIKGLKDTEELLAIIRPRKQVKAYFFGHTHKWQHHQDESGIHLINLPPVGYVFEAGRPSGWVHANLKPEGIRLELRCQDQTHAEHGQVVELKWRQA